MTSTAAGTITGGDPVEVAGSGTVRKTTTFAPHGGNAALGSGGCIGIAAQDALTGARVTVIVDRVVHEGAADGAVTAGDQVMSSAVTGRQVKKVPDSTGTPIQQDVDQARVVIGIALTTAADNGTVRWMQR
jgi:hypothetical protein